MCLGYSVSALHSDRGVLQSGALRVLSCWCVCRRIIKIKTLRESWSSVRKCIRLYNMMSTSTAIVLVCVPLCYISVFVEEKVAVSSVLRPRSTALTQAGSSWNSWLHRSRLSFSPLSPSPLPLSNHFLCSRQRLRFMRSEVPFSAGLGRVCISHALLWNTPSMKGGSLIISMRR
jgi:hypothetical protein